MAIFQWRHSWEPFRDLEQQVDRLLESIRIPFPAIRVDRHYPPVNLYELENEYLMTAELPGTVPANLELTVSGGILTLQGERAAPPGIPDERFRRHERVWGKWQRSFTLPERVDADKVAAEFIEGVLKIHLPKAGETKPRQIQVSSSTD